MFCFKMPTDYIVIALAIKLQYMVMTLSLSNFASNVAGSVKFFIVG